MKVIQRIDPEENKYSGSAFLIISASEQEWDILARFSGQAKPYPDNTDEIDIMKFNRVILKLIEAKHSLREMINQLDKCVDSSPE